LSKLLSLRRGLSVYVCCTSDCETDAKGFLIMRLCLVKDSKLSDFDT